MYKKLKENESFNDMFDTWIIAYCIDTDSFFVTNQRHFWWQYEKEEFLSEQQGVEFFQKNIEIFKSQRVEFFKNYSGINLELGVFLENTKENWKE